MEWVGLSMALGAFLAGVMLADSEYRHELELDIEPFKGLLLGLFFIAVGMSVDVGLFLRAPHLRSEEHTSELQSHHDLVCRLLLEKKKKRERLSVFRSRE